MCDGVVVVRGKCLASPFEGEGASPFEGERRKRGEEWGDKSVVPSPFQYLLAPSGFQCLPLPRTQSPFQYTVAPSVPSFHYLLTPSGPSLQYLAPSGTKWLSGDHVAGMNALQAQMVQA